MTVYDLREDPEVEERRQAQRLQTFLRVAELAGNESQPPNDDDDDKDDDKNDDDNGGDNGDPKKDMVPLEQSQQQERPQKQTRPMPNQQSSINPMKIQQYVEDTKTGAMVGYFDYASTEGLSPSESLNGLFKTVDRAENQALKDINEMFNHNIQGPPAVINMKPVSENFRPF